MSIYWYIRHSSKNPKIQTNFSSSVSPPIFLHIFPLCLSPVRSFVRFDFRAEFAIVSGIENWLAISSIYICIQWNGTKMDKTKKKYEQQRLCKKMSTSNNYTVWSRSDDLMQHRHGPIWIIRYLLGMAINFFLSSAVLEFWRRKQQTEFGTRTKNQKQ